jgi:hypothetical protein
MHLPRERQGVEHPAGVADLLLKLDAREFGIQEGDIERGVVDDELRVADELQELGMHLAEPRLLRQGLARQTVHLLGALVDVALRIQVLMIGAAGEPPIDELHAADLDDPVLLLDLEAGGLGVEDDLAHGAEDS